MFAQMRKRKGRKRTGSDSGVASVCSLLGSGRIGPGSRRFLIEAGAPAFISICLIVLLVPGLAAKEKKKATKAIAGVVVDGADNPIVGATVELSDVQSSKKLAKYSEEAGKYQFADLDPKHDYEVRASFRGMSSEVRRVSSLDDRHLVVVNFTLAPPQQPQQKP